MSFVKQNKGRNNSIINATDDQQHQKQSQSQQQQQPPLADAFKLAQIRHRRPKYQAKKKKRQGGETHNDDDNEEENSDIWQNMVVDFSRPQQWMTNSHKNDNGAKENDVAFPSSTPIIFPLYMPSSSSKDETKMHHQKDNIYQGPLYGLQNFPGFIYAPHALSPSLQLQLAYQSLTTYCEREHKTNIDLVPINVEKEEENRIEETMWTIWKDTHDDFTTNDNDDHKQQMKKSKRHKSSSQSPNNKKKNKKKYKSFDKLSWSTMGYHYDWTNRSYNDDMKSCMPIELVRLSQYFACIDWSNLNNNDGNNKDCTIKDERETTSSYYYTPTAAIVNYYNTKSIMGGHRDDLEYDFTKPVISISLGLPGVFLLGGKERHDENIIPILIRPGDVMVLGGDCRLNYHGMARVVTPPSSEKKDEKGEGLCIRSDDYDELWWLPQVDVNLKQLCKKYWITSWSDVGIKEEETINKIQNDDNHASPHVAANIPESDIDALRHYLSQHRININVRQVLPDGMESISQRTEGSSRST